MSPENSNKPIDPQPKENETLEDKMLRLKQHIEEKNDEEKPRDFETESGFTGTVFFYPGGLRNIHLNDNGNVSTFTLRNGELRFIDIHGPDDELLEDKRHRDRHIVEAQHLLSEGAFDPIEPIKDQMDLDLKGKPVDSDTE